LFPLFSLLPSQLLPYYIPQTLTVLSFHPYFLPDIYRDISDTYCDTRHLPTKQNAAIKADGKLPLYPEPFVLKASSLLDSDHWPTLSAALIALTGRRPTEVVWCGRFEAASDYTLMFSGQLKKGNIETPSFEIPTLIKADLVLDAIARLSQIQKIIEIRALPEAVLAGNASNKMINSQVRQHFSGLLEAPPRNDGTTKLSGSNLRAAYGKIATYFYCPPTAEPIFYCGKILGHQTDNYQAEALATTLHYFTYCIVDDRGDFIGERGVRLGLPGVKQLYKKARQLTVFTEPATPTTNASENTETTVSLEPEVIASNTVNTVVSRLVETKESEEATSNVETVTTVETSIETANHVEAITTGETNVEAAAVVKPKFSRRTIYRDDRWRFDALCQQMGFGGNQAERHHALLDWMEWALQEIPTLQQHNTELSENMAAMERAHTHNTAKIAHLSADNSEAMAKIAQLELLTSQLQSQIVTLVGQLRTDRVGIAQPTVISGDSTADAGGSVIVNGDAKSAIAPNESRQVAASLDTTSQLALPQSIQSEEPVSLAVGSSEVDKAMAAIAALTQAITPLVTTMARLTERMEVSEGVSVVQNPSPTSRKTSSVQNSSPTAKKTSSVQKLHQNTSATQGVDVATERMEHTAERTPLRQSEEVRDVEGLSTVQVKERRSTVVAKEKARRAIQAVLDYNETQDIDRKWMINRNLIMALTGNTIHRLVIDEMLSAMHIDHYNALCGFSPGHNISLAKKYRLKVADVVPWLPS
ncbi:protelomerase family protein, partial [Aerosakkonemataceae cyanobacterium BLCC-F50]